MPTQTKKAPSAAGVRRGRDAAGPFYRKTRRMGSVAQSVGGKHRYVAGDAASRERAKARAAASSVKHPPSWPAAAVTGGRTPAKPARPALTSDRRARAKLADRTRVARAAAYRRLAPRTQ